MSEPKPGRTTTEFGLTAVLDASALFKAAGEGLSMEELIAVTIINVAYVFGRAYVKGQSARPAPIIFEPQNKAERSIFEPSNKAEREQ
jgi:hypothetical protein